VYANKSTTAQRGGYTKEDFRFRDLPTRDSRKGDSEKRNSTKSGLKMHLFYNKKEGIHPEEVRAAFAYPFIYPPVTINGEVYFEGAARDPISFGNLLVDESEGRVRAAVKDIERIVLIDILGSLDRYLLREPRDLLDAFSLSILAPAVAHAQKEIARFHTALHEANEDLGMADTELKEKAEREEAIRAHAARQAPRAKRTSEAERERQARRREEALKGLTPPDQALVRITNFTQMSFDIDEDLGPHITDWSYSNMSRLFEIGLRDGKRFWESNRDALALPPDPRPR
jgi:hypothetical protein